MPNSTVEAQNLATLKEIERQDALFRGLKPLADVPAQFISSDQLRENLTKEMEQYYSKEDAKNDATELWLMRLIDKRDIDLYQLQIDLQSEQVLGYYDQKVKEFFIRSDGAKLSPTAKETLAHEYVHALQDQHFDLQKLLPDKTTDDDRSTAIRSLVEGDATVSGILFAQSHFSPAEYQSIIDDSANSDTTVLDSAPKYISDSLYFPYNEGVQFVIALGITNSFDPINKALADPPVSSEQIMHPEKYTAANRDMPKIVAAPPLTDTLGAGWTHTDNGTLGEFDLKELLTFNNATDPEGAAAGWGGGTYNLYTNADNALSMINTTWDTTKDATQFEDALNETFANDTKDGNVIVGSDGLRFYEVKRTNDDISMKSNNSSQIAQQSNPAKPPHRSRGPGVPLPLPFFPPTCQEGRGLPCLGSPSCRPTKSNNSLGCPQIDRGAGDCRGRRVLCIFLKARDLLIFVVRVVLYRLSSRQGGVPLLDTPIPGCYTPSIQTTEYLPLMQSLR